MRASITIPIPLKQIILESKLDQNGKLIIEEGILSSLKSGPGLAAVGAAGLYAGSKINDDYRDNKVSTPGLTPGKYAQDKFNQGMDKTKEFGNKMFGNNKAKPSIQEKPGTEDVGSKMPTTPGSGFGDA